MNKVGGKKTVVFTEKLVTFRWSTYQNIKLFEVVNGWFINVLHIFLLAKVSCDQEWLRRRKTVSQLVEANNSGQCQTPPYVPTLWAPGCSAHCWATFSKFSWLRPVRAKRAPSLAKWIAVAAPMPELAPWKKRKREIEKDRNFHTQKILKKPHKTKGTSLGVRSSCMKEPQLRSQGWVTAPYQQNRFRGQWQLLHIVWISGDLPWDFDTFISTHKALRIL